MNDYDFSLQTFALTKEGAIRRVESLAHAKFGELVEAVRRDETKDSCLLRARLTVVSVKRCFFRFTLNYLVEIHCGPMPNCKITKCKKPSKKAIKKTPKKVYKKRDSKGKFTK